MDKIVAYDVVSKKLKEYGALEFTALASLVGNRIEEEVTTDEGSFRVVTSIDWRDSGKQSLQIRCLVHNNNSFRYDPLEEEIVVHKH